MKRIQFLILTVAVCMAFAPIAGAQNRTSSGQASGLGSGESSAGVLASGDALAKQVQLNAEQLRLEAQKLGAKVQNALGRPIEGQLAAILDELQANPRSLKKQIEVANLLLAYIDNIKAPLVAAKQSDIIALRDRCVQGLQHLAKEQQAKADQFAARAGNSSGPESDRYRRLSETCSRFAAAYSQRADEYSKLDLTSQIVRLQSALEYLDAASEVVKSVRDHIGPILGDVSTLEELRQLSVSLEGVEESLRKFADVVLAGALAGDVGAGANDTPTSAGKSNKVRN